MSESINLNVENWKIRIDERKRNRMKIVVKLGKEEAEAYKSFEETVKPAEVTSEVFAKSLFFNGIEAMNKELSSMVEKYMEEHPEASGVSVSESDTSGNVEIISEAT
jgi:hypothetical protein